MKWAAEPDPGFAGTANTAVGRYRVWQRNAWEWIGAHESGQHTKAADEAQAVAWCEGDHADRVRRVVKEASDV